MAVKLDSYDKKLLYQLDINARQSYVQLAKKVGLSKDTIKYRINNYLQNGLIDCFYTMIDASKLGFYSIRVYFKFSKAKQEDENNIIESLKNEKRVFYLTKIEGEYNIAFGFFAKNLFEFQEFWKEFKQKYREKIGKEKLGIFITLHHFNRNYFSRKPRTQISKPLINEPKPAKLDYTNKRILSILSNNARKQIIDICNKVNLTSKAVILRIKNLEKRGIILGYKPKINLDKLGYSMYKVDLKVADTRKIKPIQNYIFQLPNLIHSEEVFGGTDFEFDLECREYEEFNQIISKIKQEIGENIESIKHYRTIKIYKTIYLPEAL